MPGTGASINVALPPGTDDNGWLLAYGAVIAPAVRAFRPDVLVTQCGCDTHHDDPLAGLELTVDGQRTAIAALHRLSHEVADGKWLALGGGGYGIVRCVPRTWTHLLAEASGRPLAAETPIPAEWSTHLRSLGARGELPLSMGEAASPTMGLWTPGGDSWLDRSIASTRQHSFGYLDLDPLDPDAGRTESAAQ